MQPNTTPQRLPTLSRMVHLKGQEYLVVSRQDAFSPSIRTFSAWQRTGIMGNHGTVSSLGREDGFWGQVGTERDGEEFEHLKPGSPERLHAISNKCGRRASEARAAIREAFPEIAGFEREAVLLAAHELASEAAIDQAVRP